MTTKFRYIGLTDECVECQCCGRGALRSTVVLEMLDEDGNGGEVTYYGSTCAARALGVKGGGREVRKSAERAQLKMRDAARYARHMLNHYGLSEREEPSGEVLRVAVSRYIFAHRNAMWFDSVAAGEWAEQVLDMHRRHSAVLAQAALVGIKM